MTIAQYNKLSLREKFELKLNETLLNVCYFNDDGQLINLKTASDIVMLELNTIGIITKDKTIDEIRENLQILYKLEITNLFKGANKEKTEKLIDRINFFKMYLFFLALYLVDYNPKKVSNSFSNELEEYNDYVVFLKEIKF